MQETPDPVPNWPQPTTTSLPNQGGLAAEEAASHEGYKNVETPRTLYRNKEVAVTVATDRSYMKNTI